MAHGRHSGVTIATVTYGDRAEMCIAVVERALATGAEHAVVVDNGSDGPSADALREWAGPRPEITLIRHERNEGSASGFRTALQHAAAADTSSVWLLDDDNMPAQSALAAARALQDGTSQGIVVACLRIADEMQVAVLDGAPITDTLDIRGSFVGFDLRNRLRRTTAARERTPLDSVEVPWAPYGGLLIPAAAVDVVGLPRLSFVLYGDDRDYCERLRAAGYRIVLTRDATIDDISDRWAPSTASSRIPSGNLEAMVRSDDPHRVFHLVRNSVFDDVRRARRHHAVLRLTLNGAVFLGYAALTAVRARRPRFILLVARASIDGALGRWY